MTEFRTQHSHLFCLSRTLLCRGAGLAIKDFWKVDADTVVFVADPSLGNILNFNIGANIDLQVPPVSSHDGVGNENTTQAS